MAEGLAYGAMRKAYPFTGDARVGRGWALADKARMHVELALKELEEGKALALHFSLSDILEKVEERGRWTVTELDKAASRVSEKRAHLRL